MQNSTSDGVATTKRVRGHRTGGPVSARRYRAAAVVAVAAVAWLQRPDIASGTTTGWTGTSGFWTDPTWSNGVPAAGQDVSITPGISSGIDTVTYNYSGPAISLNSFNFYDLNGGQVVLNQAAYNLTVAGAQSLSSNATDNLTGGNDTITGSGYLGLGAINTGALATFNVGGTGTLTAPNVYVGSGTTLPNGSAFGGVLNIQPGATVNVGGQLVLWNTSNTIVNFSGGTLNTGSLNTSSAVGSSASRFNWNGGTLNLTSTGAPFQVDSNPVSGWSNLGFALSIGPGMGLSVASNAVVGYTGTGTVNQMGGTTNFTANLDLGYQSTAFGTYNLTGGSLTAAQLNIGGNELGNAGGLGILDVSQSGSATVTGQLILYNTSGTQINLATSGTLTVGSLNTASGSGYKLNWTGGTLNITGSGGLTIGTGGTLPNMTIGSGKTLSVTSTYSMLPGSDLYLLAGGSLTAGNELFSTGTNVISQYGGSNTANYFYLGSNPGAIGTYTQSGGTDSQASMTIGNYPAGNGTYILTGTGSLTASGSVYLGANPGGGIGPGIGVFNVSGGAATITGAIVTANTVGTAIQLAGGQLNTSAIYLGGNSAAFSWTGGTLNLTGGGTTLPTMAVPGGGTLLLPAGGTLVVPGTLTVNNSGKLNLSGGTLAVGTLSPTSASEISWTSGTLVLTGSSLIIGNGAASTTVSAVAWGDNANGEIGNGTKINSSSPAAVPSLSSGVTGVAGGGAHSLFVQNGGLSASGYNGYGQLGNGTVTNTSSPVAVTGLSSGVTAVAAGNYHSLAVQNGAAYAWGYNYYGQLGIGSTTQTSPFGVTTPVAVTGLSSGVTALAASYYNSMAVQNGALYAWGYNAYGQLGNGTTTNSSSPVAVNGLSSGVTSIALGLYHSLAVQNGAAFGWGENLFGQVGNGTTSNTSTPAAVSGLSSGVTAVAAGDSFSLAVQNGAVYAWGANYDGQLGNGTTSNSSLPVAVPGITGTITAVAASSDSSYALGADGSIWDWGSNYYGQLGLGTNVSSYSTPQHLLAPAGYEYTSISGNCEGGTVVATLASIGSPLGASVTLDSGQTLDITGAGQSLTLTGSLTINGGGLSVPTINQTAGNFTTTGTLALAGSGGNAAVYSFTGGVLSAGAVTVGAGGTFNWTGGALNITATGSSFGGTLTVPTGGTLKLDGTITDPVIVSPGGLFDLDANPGSGILVRSLNTIALNGGSTPPAQMNVLPAGNHANRQLIVTSGLSIAGTTGAWRGLVDLANNDMDITAGGATLATVTMQVTEGFNETGGGNWAGAGGITSSSAAADTSHLTALGVIQNNQSGTPIYSSTNPFDTHAPGAADILVKYTYFGDANLDGQVDGSDYSKIDNGYAVDKIVPGLLTGWFNGDFNYDGTIDGSDYALIDNAFNNQTSNLSRNAQVASSTAQVAAVPEPVGGPLTACLAAVLTARRRRNAARA